MYFIDTNVLNYALLSQDEQKRKCALEILGRAFSEENLPYPRKCCLNVQMSFSRRVE